MNHVLCLPLSFYANSLASYLLQRTLCSKRKLICKYCSQAKMAMEMSDHENYCGSRTERCDRCPDWVQLREWDSHQSRFHSNIQRRFRERSVIAQTETIIDYNASKFHISPSMPAVFWSLLCDCKALLPPILCRTNMLEMEKGTCQRNHMLYMLRVLQ